MKDTRVLIIDDEKENVRYLTTILEENGFRDIHSAFDGEEGLQKVKETRPGLILLDLRMPKKSGIYVFNELKASSEHKDIPVIILTGEGGFLKHLAELRAFHEDKGGLGSRPTEEILNQFINSRPDAFLEKPIEPEPLMAVIRKILITLDEVQAKRLAEVNAVRDRRLQGGFLFKDLQFDSDERSLNHLTAVATALSTRGHGLPDKIVWRSVENQDMLMTREEALAFHAAVTKWVYETYKASWDHKAAIQAITSIEEAEGYDLKRGWPDNRL